MKETVFTSIHIDEFKKLIFTEVENAFQAIQSKMSGRDYKLGENYATREEVAKALHISKPTLNQLTKEGKLLGYRIGGRVLYKWDEINEALIKMKT